MKRDIAPERTYTDEELLQQMRLDDQQSFALLFRRYWQPLYLAAGRRLGGASEAQDLVQEIMVTVWSKRKELVTNDAGSLENYLFTLLKYGILDTLAYSHKKELRMKVLQQLIVLQESHVLEGLISKELGEAIHHAIEHMPVTMRKVVLLSRLHQYSIAEIAGQLSLSEQTVKNLLTKAIKRLRYCIEQHYRDGGTSPQAFLIIVALANALPGV